MTIYRHSAPNGGADESKALAARLLTSLPAATFELETFARLAGVVASRTVPTAAMECKHRPRLLINPDFVAKHCRRDEHLFLLVMHELWHVLLAHTSLYPRVTQAQNIAFDAIINARLMQYFRNPEYQGFFDALNPPDVFPHLLLRPPVGWPEAPVYPDIGPPGTRRVLEQLYPRPGAPQRLPFYGEILDLIRQYLRDQGWEEIWIDGAPVLLGDHSASGDDARTLSNRYFRDVMGRIVHRWPVVPTGIGGRGRGGAMGDWQPGSRPVDRPVQRAFALVLRRSLGARRGTHQERKRTPIDGITGIGVLPNPRDRLAPARRQLGAPSTLWSLPGKVNARVRERERKSHIYLDVSGSMSQVIPELVGLIAPYVLRGQADVFQFSTLVEPLTLASLRHGVLQTTGGTDITCVLDHLLQTRLPLRRVLILTDGYVGEPSAEIVQTLKARGIRVYVVLPAESPYRDDLLSLAETVTVLPPL